MHCNCIIIICSQYVGRRYRSFLFRFIFFALMCIAKLHSKRCAITINLINCAGRERERKMLSAMSMCVCVVDVNKHTIYSNFNSFRYLLKRSAKAFKYRTLEMKNLLWFCSKDTVCAITPFAVYNFFPLLLQFFFFQFQT